MQKTSRPRRIHPGWYAGTFVVVLAVVAQVLYSTGMYGAWRDGRSVDRACGGNLAQGGLEGALGSSHSHAEDLGSGDGALGDCLVKGSSGPHSALQMTLRWSADAVSTAETRARFGDLRNGYRGAVAPLGAGWPGVVRNDGTPSVLVSLDCADDPAKSLVVTGTLTGPPPGAQSDPAVLTGLGRVTAETALDAAGRHGCRTSGGQRLTRVTAPPYGTGRLPSEPLGRAAGSCSPLRSLASAAAHDGVPEAVEFPTDARAPQVNCYLATRAGAKAGYGLYAFYGTSAKAFREKGGAPALKLPDEPQDFASATAACPGSSEPATFLVTRLYDTDTRTYPVAHYSPDFANAALKAFADSETKRRGCDTVRPGRS
ncbi:hypothetical protein [Streptomyces sp. NBC_00083]|uniref:hypothetical protein n=1 Tax=Streptomyces sp. NBC_00083 TaxID=2975647 RepID=UPI00225B22EB|nr:hypothetical protein [Streptomyces sp. NBC_00083]MCX5382641.1 hypothetical protein [Streptomyces sp. NBC_00083]